MLHLTTNSITVSNLVFYHSIEKAMETEYTVEFDSLIVAKMLGYQSTTDYYPGFSADKHVKDIKIPFLTMNSLDDPIIE